MLLEFLSLQPLRSMWNTHEKKLENMVVVWYRRRGREEKRAGGGSYVRRLWAGVADRGHTRVWASSALARPSARSVLVSPDIRP